MKKFLSLLLVVVLVLGIAGCANQPADESATASAETSTEASTPADTSAEG